MPRMSVKSSLIVYAREIVARVQSPTHNPDFILH